MPTETGNRQERDLQPLSLIIFLPSLHSIYFPRYFVTVLFPSLCFSFLLFFLSHFFSILYFLYQDNPLLIALTIAESALTAEKDRGLGPEGAKRAAALRLFCSKVSFSTFYYAILDFFLCLLMYIFHSSLSVCLFVLY
jgi:hypothetical protein